MDGEEEGSGHLKRVGEVRNHMSVMDSKSVVWHVEAARYTFITCGKRKRTYFQTRIVYKTIRI